MGQDKSKNSAKKRGLFVVVQRVLANAPTGFFNPHSGASMRVVPLADWNRSLLAAALLEA